LAAGAMAFFTEKYGDRVRVVDVAGVSLELCGGTHVDTTGEIALFRFTHETGSQAGVRRIEAITGPAAYRLSRELERRLGEASAALKTQPEHLMHRIETLLEENRRLEKRVEELLKHGGSSGLAKTELFSLPGNIQLHYGQTTLEDKKQIGLMMDDIRAKSHNTIAVVVSSVGTSPAVYVAVTDDLIDQGVKAGEIASAVSQHTGARGGGRPHFASGGIGDPHKIPSTGAQLSTIIVPLLDSHRP
jgi:alanyl-tRNA synthetase